MIRGRDSSKRRWLTSLISAVDNVFSVTTAKVVEKMSSVFGVRCSVFGVRCSVFGVRCSVFGCYLQKSLAFSIIF